MSQKMQTTWTKKHSRNAVAARARRRIERGEAATEAQRPRNVRRPRGRARFWISIRDRKIGDSMTLSLSELPWPGRFVDSRGQQLSTAQICRAVKTILNHD